MSQKTIGSSNQEVILGLFLSIIEIRRYFQTAGG